MKSIILLSAGLDSTVAMAKALTYSDVSLCLTFDYGQRAGKQEIKRAGMIAKHYGIDHEVIELSFLRKITKTSLVNENAEVPHLKEDLLDDKITLETASKVWVPNRNGLFINVAASYGESYEFSHIITGFNREEASTFPDNSIEFINQVNSALEYSTLSKIKVTSPTIDLNKEEIINLGNELNIPWHLLWSCYYGEEKMCGKCESCQRLLRGLKNSPEIKNKLNFVKEELPC